jgi:phenylalanyl-tRNA synthetase beta subunit
MKFSRKLLQKYIVDTLGDKNELIKKISAKAFEVEDVETLISGDEIFEIKVLPNRAHDATGHAFMVREIARVCNLKFNEELYMSEVCLDKIFDVIPNDAEVPKIKIEEAKACTTFLSARIENIKVDDSEKWLKEALQNIGQKSINNIVDITNYALFVVNKPMHAYDADKIDGEIVVRFAKDGETITTLDNREVKLDPSILIIADQTGPLSIAGIKGGKRAMVDNNTTNIILESANFNAGLIRKTSQKLNLKTDASKRYENGLADSLCWPGINMTIKLIKDMSATPETKFSAVVSVGYREPKSDYKVGVSAKDIRNTLGADISDAEIETILKTVCNSVEKVNAKNKLESIYKDTLDKKYVSGASVLYDAPETFDCSSLTAYLYKEAGISIPRISIDQFIFSKKITKDELQFGDLIFSNSQQGKIHFESIEYKKGTKFESGVDHVGFYLGEGKVLHATKSIGKVLVENIDDSSTFGSKIVAYGRICDDLNTERFACSIPHYRLDLRLREDLVEEVARLYGLDNIPSIIPDLKKENIEHSPEFIKEIAIKNQLFKNNFSEVISYSFRNTGDMQVLKAVAEDKSYLRTNLFEGVCNAFEKNFKNAPLLNLDEVKIFEVGSIFEANNESRRVCILIGGNKKKGDYYKNTLEEIKKNLYVSKVTYEKIENTFAYFEAEIQDVKINSENILLDSEVHREVKYKNVSPYPFTSQDVSFFADTDAATLQKEFENLNLENCVNIYKFDEFTKKFEDGSEKTSFGFRFVFQSQERTLTNEESLQYFAPVALYLGAKNYEVR